ncbi:GDSL-type esterase/lipase family protein [Aquirufa lenticrescens]
MRHLFLLFWVLSLPLFAKVDSTQVCHSCNVIRRDSDVAELAPKWKSGTLKVLHLGDSHVQIGHFSSEIKRLLGVQQEGIQFPYSLAKSVDGRVLKSKASGRWEGTSILKPSAGWNIGLAGYAVSTRDSTAQITFTLKDSLARFNQIRVWTNSDSCAMIPDVGPEFTLDKRGQSGNVAYWDFKSYTPVSQFTLALQKSASNQDEFTLHGVEVLSNVTSIDYQDLGVAGAQFTHLKSRGNVDLDQIELLKPDLLICSFGTNEAYNANWNLATYRQALVEFMQDVKSKSPGTVFLFTSPPDTRSQKRVPKFQQEVVQTLSDLPAAYYDLNQVMGGFGSSAEWVKNGCFLKDQLHFTKEGYQIQAKLFVLALFKSWGESTASEILQNQVNQHTVSIGITK